MVEMLNDDCELEKRVNIISSIGEEIIGLDSLKELLTAKKNIYAYDGFEPSGKIHLAQGILRVNNVNKLVDAGIKFKFWIADWFALMNLKLGGDINKIRKAGYEMIEIWKACGMKTDAVDSEGNPMIQFIWSSEEITKRSEEYWKLVLDIATKFSLTRIRKCTQIMGRKEDINTYEIIKSLEDKVAELENIIKTKEHVKFKEVEAQFNEINFKFSEINQNNIQELACSQIFYPVMQCADIFFLEVSIASLGMDQRKVNSLALEYCDKIKQKNKPIIISHHMLMGLDGSDKMSKSNPDNTIFMDDPPSEVKRKINKAFCEPNNTEKNPLLDWAKHIIFPINNKFIISENSKFNESQIIFTNFEELKNAFFEGKIHPSRLKNAMVYHINELLKPIQDKIKNK
jgi:tyrosyl-tRNA synthetase